MMQQTTDTSTMCHEPDSIEMKKQFLSLYKAHEKPYKPLTNTYSDVCSTETV